jgi:protein SCO1/2
MKLRTLAYLCAVTGAVAFLLLHGYGGNGVDTGGLRRDSCCPTETVLPGAFTDRSLYQIDSTWETDGGRGVKLGELAGRVQVVTMFFANCQMACPLLVQGMKRIEAAVPEALRSHLGFVLVTFDTERDTLQVLHAYRARQQLSTNRWVILRGESADTLELAALLGVRYKKDLRGDFAHSNIITVLDPAGEIVYQQVGLNQDVEPAVAAIQRAAAPNKRGL